MKYSNGCISVAGMTCVNWWEERSQMIHGPRYLPSIEIPIARIFRKITGRKMTEAERHCFRIKAAYRVRTEVTNLTSTAQRNL
jgi:hypothetical protein